MKAIILAAGYATRLYPLTLNIPKALLKIGDKTILEHIINEVETVEGIDEIIIVSNHKFYDQFIGWLGSKIFKKKLKIIDDGSMDEDNRLGAIGDIRYAITTEKIDDDIMVIAGDNYFTYRLSDLYNYYTTIQKNCIVIRKVEDINELRRIAVVLLDGSNKVLDMEEKPQFPKSNLGVYATYIYTRDTLPLFDEYLDAGNKPDAPGYFPSWLYVRRDVYAYTFNGECYDIGTHQSYKEVQEKFGK